MAIIGVVGLGTMGLGIAQLYAAAGHTVVATDGHAPARDSAVTRMREGLSRRVIAGKLSQESMDATITALNIVEGLEAFHQCDLVIEAIVESIDAKKNLFRGLERVSRPETVFATNTSALPVSQIAQGLLHPQRMLGLHFFNPAPVMKLVELVTLPTTAPQATALALQVTQAAGKTVIECADRPGFIVNRCARPFYGEALAMLEEGTDPQEIDAAMLSAGYRLGPFSLMDLIGADVSLAASQGMFERMNHHPRYHVFESLAAQVVAGHLGVKSGSGFLVGTKVAPCRNDAVVLRIEAALANEAGSLVDEGQLDTGAIDLALKLGLNFPRGPFQSASDWGTSRIQDVLALQEQDAPPHLKGRYILSHSLKTLL